MSHRTTEPDDDTPNREALEALIRDADGAEELVYRARYEREFGEAPPS